MNEIERADIVKRAGEMTVFKGAGNSHFTFVKDEGFHVTTDIPGLNQGVGIKEHNPIMQNPFGQ